MKKFIVSILAVLYLATSSGAAVYLHYCMGEISHSSLLANNDKTCGTCGMEKEETNTNGCCKDEFHWIKVDDDQQTQTIHFVFSKPYSELLSFDFFDGVYFTPQENLTCTDSKAPQRSSELPVYLLNCIFRI